MRFCGNSPNHSNALIDSNLCEGDFLVPEVQASRACVDLQESHGSALVGCEHLNSSWHAKVSLNANPP